MGLYGQLKGYLQTRPTDGLIRNFDVVCADVCVKLQVRISIHEQIHSDHHPPVRTLSCPFMSSWLNTATAVWQRGCAPENNHPS